MNDETKKKFNWKFSLLVYIVCFTLQIFVFSSIQYLFQVLAGWKFDDSGGVSQLGLIWGIWIGLIISELGLFSTVFLFFYLKNISPKLLFNEKNKEFYRIIKYSLFTGLITLIVGVGTGLIEIVIMNLFQIQFPKSIETLNEFLIPKNGVDLMVWVLIMAFIVAPFEEFFARGAIQKGLQNSLSERKNGIFFSIILSSIGFALFHLDPFRFFPIFCESLVIGYAYYKTDNLLTTIIAHGMLNSTIIILSIFGI
ncbi:MAG: lysostaphin resistance A-like protein [Candidatus Helarchaeota archaeon]